MTPRARLLASALAAACLTGPGTVALAQDPPRKRVVVLKFNGTQAQRARAAVLGGLGRWATLVDEDGFSAALSRARGATRPDKIAAACRTVGVDAVVEGTMHRSRRTWGVEIVVRNCENGEKMAPGGRAVYSMRNLGGIGVIRGTIWDRIGDAIAASGAGGGGGTRVASSTRSRSRSSPPPPARSGTASRTTSTNARTSAAAAMECLFTEDEPPEGFPSHGAWVRRRNEFLVNCERERTRRIAEERRRREEAARRAEEERQRRIEEERLAREAEARRQREEEDRRRREEEDRQRRIAQEEERRRREAEERRLEADRIEREARRRAEEDRRREEEARVAEERRYERDRYEDDRRTREEDDLNRRVEEYREQLRSERGMRADAADISSRSDVEPGDYEDYRDDRDDRESYRDDRGTEDGGHRERSERDYDDRDPVYDPSRDEEEEDRRHRADRDDERDSDRDQDQEEEQDEEPRSARRRRPVIFDIGAGVAFMSRNMTVEQAGADKPRTYSAPGYPELTVHAEFFPVALASPTSGAAGLGIFGLYRRHLFLETSGPTDLGETIKVATAEQELLVGAMFRTAMGRSPTSPIVSLAAGYGYFAFELDPEAMALLKDEVQMPTMIYRNLVVNAGLTIPISGSSLGVEVGGSYRYVVDVGQAARDLFGADTTGGNGFAGRAALGGEATFIAEGVTWSLSGDYTVFSTKFTGATSAEGGMVDAFPSGTDKYLRGLFLAAYRFR